MFPLGEYRAGNVKTAIVELLKSVAMRYVFRYLAEFQYRFNRRFQLPEMLARLASVATRAAPRPRNTPQNRARGWVVRHYCAQWCVSR